METQYCQSCAMPMSDAGLYGTNADGSKSGDYCKYCYENGVFAQDCTMDEMIAFCVPHMVSAHADMSEDEARKMMREFFPTLKRWHQH
jgi:hypothetical protein